MDEEESSLVSGVSSDAAPELSRQTSHQPGSLAASHVPLWNLTEGLVVQDCGADNVLSGSTLLVQNHEQDMLVGSNEASPTGLLVSAGDNHGILLQQDNVTRFVSVTDLSKFGIHLAPAENIRPTEEHRNSSLMSATNTSIERSLPVLPELAGFESQSLNSDLRFQQQSSKRSTVDELTLTSPQLRAAQSSTQNMVAPKEFLNVKLDQQRENIPTDNKIIGAGDGAGLIDDQKKSDEASDALSTEPFLETSPVDAAIRTDAFSSHLADKTSADSVPGHSKDLDVNLPPSQASTTITPCDKDQNRASTETMKDKVFPQSIKEGILIELKQGDDHDIVWQCNGGIYKAHKLILASSSEFLKAVFTHSEDFDMIQTPELSCQVVKYILCLFYTGKVNIKWEYLSEVNDALKQLGFCGDNVTLIPFGDVKEEEGEETKDCKPATNFLAVELENKKGKKKRNSRYDTRDDFVVGDSAFDEDILGLGSEDEDWTPQKVRKRLKKEASSEEEDDEEPAEPPVNIATPLKRGRKSLKTPDSRECFRTRGPGKGERSFKLSQDLFQGRHTDFIYVCHACYAYFETEKKLNTHKEDTHGGVALKGPHHTANSKEYKCPTCSEILAVKHLVWFIKHLQFCGKDEERAHQYIAADDYSSDEEDNPNFKKNYKKRNNLDLVKDTPERLRITGEQKGRNLQTLSKVLVGAVVDYLWGCQTCYTVHLSEQALEEHVNEEHRGKKSIGNCWNSETENYTCRHCKQVQHSRHLVWFIYHMKKCMVNTTQVVMIKKEQNEEEETDEDTTEDVQDPLGVVNKIYKVCNEKSAWICEALFGRIISVLYPCHICYSVFISETELRSHCRSNHPGQNNTPENGVYYNKTNGAYECPGCKISVCKNQKNSIYFTYHYRKCNGQTFSVTKSCPECNKEFDSYSNYRLHVDTKCGTHLFSCNSCPKVFPSNGRLNHHVQYVHSAIKPFSCTQCDKSYKRKAELLEHEEMSHSVHFNYSCEKCGKQFYGKKNLALHMKTHYTEEEKKHVCSICGYRFAKVKFLKNHLTTHSDVRQFSCEICGARVKTRDTLKQHRKKLHNLLTPLPKTALVLDPATGVQQTVYIKDEAPIQQGT